MSKHELHDNMHLTLYLACVLKRRLKTIIFSMRFEFVVIFKTQAKYNGLETVFQKRGLNIDEIHMRF